MEFKVPKLVPGKLFRASDKPQTSPVQVQEQSNEPSVPPPLVSSPASSEEVRPETESNGEESSTTDPPPRLHTADPPPRLHTADPPPPRLQTADPPPPAPDAPRLPYTEPAWSGTPSIPHHLSVIKNGVELSDISLANQPYCVIGRLPSCHVRLEHPSISRYHAVVQHRPTADPSSTSSSSEQHTVYSSVPREAGYYVYDLHSTHGTFINKNKIQPRLYYRLRIGQTVRFGGSSRIFVLEQDEGNLQEMVEAEAESEREELQRLKAEREEMLARAEAERLKKEKEEAEMGATWGMVMDDVIEEREGEEVELDPQKEAYYISDPKKALRKFFEREGLELEYETEESGQQRSKVYIVKVSLPIDTISGETVYAEGSGRGKKEAVLECALTACRMLDAEGILRESRKAHRTQSRDWEQNDYYDSDEDNFLDRTGDVDKKRIKRMKKAGKIANKAETFESLQTKLSGVEQELAKLQQQLSVLRGGGGEDEEGGDSLDVFMKSVGHRAERGKITEIKLRIHQLKKEEEQLKKLVKVARPYQLPKAIDHTHSLENISATTITTTNIVTSSITTVTHTTTSTITSKTLLSPTSTNKTPLSPTSVSKTPLSPTSVSSPTPTSEAAHPATTTTSSLTTPQPPASTEERTQRKRKRSSFGPSLPSTANKTTSESHQGEGTLDYASWLPPENQSGDGKTALNEKYGY